MPNSQAFAEDTPGKDAKAGPQWFCMEIKANDVVINLGARREERGRVQALATLSSIISSDQQHHPGASASFALTCIGCRSRIPTTHIKLYNPRMTAGESCSGRGLASQSQSHYLYFHLWLQKIRDRVGQGRRG